MAKPGLPHSLSRIAGALSMLLAVAACGGGGGDTNPPSDPTVDGPSYTVSGTIDGLERSIELVIEIEPVGNRDDALVVRETLTVRNGSFSFASRVPQGWTAYVLTSDLWRRPYQNCLVSRTGGAMLEGYDADLGPFTADVNDLHYRCGRGYAISGIVTGDIGPAPASGQPPLIVVAQTPLPRSATYSPQSASIRAPGPFDMAVVGASNNVPILAGTPYNVWIQSNAERACSVTNGTGTMPERDVDGVVVDCMEGVEVRFKVLGLKGSGLQVELRTKPPGPDPLGLDPSLIALEFVASNGDHTFSRKAYPGDQYVVGVSRQPDAPPQECTVVNGTGTVPDDQPVTDIEVRCPAPQKSWRYDSADTLFTNAPLGGNTAGWAVVDDHFQAPLLPHPGGGQSSLVGTELHQNLFARPGTDMAVYSSEDGSDYRIATEAAHGPQPRITSIRTRWWLRKNSPQTDVRFLLSHLYLDAWVDNAGSTGWAMRELNARAWIALRAYTVSPIDGSVTAVPVHAAIGHVDIVARRLDDDRVEWSTHVGSDAEATVPVFGADSIVADLSNASPTVGGSVFVKLKEPLPLIVDLSKVTLNQRVMVEMVAAVQALNGFSRESHAIAYLRDPVTFDPAASDGGVELVAMDGVSITEPGNLPADFAPQPDTPPAAVCTARGAPRATLQFATSTFSVSEGDPTNRSITVTRSGSTAGALTARVTLQPGTATAGLDYRAGDVVVRFADGDATPRTVSVPVLDDTEPEAGETIALTLGDVAGCAEVGALGSATVTLRDDDTLETPPATYTLGGTVTGLVGSGLVVENIATEALPIIANGAFQFPRVFAVGHVYRIQVTNQPQNPRQACTVANGEGKVTNANIGNVQINCSTLGEPGGLDPGFGTGGRVWSTTMGATPADTALARQADGKLLVVGGTSGLLRLLPNGTPDAGFGTAGNGLVTVTSGQRTPYNVTAVVVQPDGRIVVAGFAPAGVSGRADMLVARYLADGTPDAGFANGTGIATFDFGTWNDAASRVLVQPDGGLLLAGRVSDASGSGATDFAVLRLTAAGQIDTTYGSNGWARANVAGGYDVPRGAVLTPDGGVVLAGRVAASGGANGDVGIVRFTAAGLPDAGFGDSGNGTVRVITAVHDEARDITVLPDGRLLVVGERDLPNIPGAAYELWLARYFANGQLDTGFGNGGVATLARQMRGYAVALQADGTVWVAGETPSVDGSSADYGLARFTATGQPDGSFGAGGLLGVDMYGGFDTPGALLLQADGRLLIAGRAYNGSTLGLGLARISP